MALVTSREGATEIVQEQVGEFKDGLHTISVAGRKSVDPQRWQPMAPGSWEQGTTLLPGESALEVIQQVEKELAAEQGVGGASEPSALLSPAARDMIIASEARIAQIEGRAPPKPPHDELAEIMALRAEQDALARASKAAKKARDASDAALPPAESTAARRLRRARFCVNPLWWLSALCCRCRAAVRCPKLYDVDTLERLGPNSFDTGDVLLLSPANTGMAQLFGSSRWVLSAKKRPLFLRRLYINAIILPRQAPDKHGENSTKDGRLRTAPQAKQAVVLRDNRAQIRVDPFRRKHNHG